MIIKYFDYVSVSLMTNRDLWDTYQSYLKGDKRISDFKGSLLLIEIANRVNCRDYLSDNPPWEVIEAVLDIFSTYKLNGAGDEIC